LALCLLGCGLLGCGSALAGKGPEVRVLLYDGTGPLMVGHSKGPQEIRLAGENELLVPGRGRLQSWTPGGQGPWRVGERVVRGRIAVRAKQGRIQVLNRVDLEDYVASTVGGEMMASWPREALRAQAVATRTYVLHEAARRRRSDWDVRATTASQVYRGLEDETRETLSATRATAGEVLTYRGEPILAVFHSTAGGRTETAGEVWGQDLPYLRVVDVEDEDDAPHTYWRTTIASGDLEAVCEAAAISVGRLEEVEVVVRTGSGRVKRLALRGSERESHLEGASLRSLISAMGLRSTLFEVRKVEGGFAFVGSGHGHGVGMSQWGARAMARQGHSYQRILSRFYPGARLETWRSRRVASRGPEHGIGFQGRGSSGGR
jgi:stage II sporulation protein D